MSVRMDVPPHLLLALVDVVAVVDSDLPSAREYHGSPSAVPPYSQDSPPQYGMAGIIWPLLNVLDGDFEEVSELYAVRKAHIRELFVGIPARTVDQKTMGRRHLENVLFTLDPEQLQIRIGDGESDDLVSLFVSTISQSRFHCTKLVSFYFIRPLQRHVRRGIRLRYLSIVLHADELESIGHGEDGESLESHKILPRKYHDATSFTRVLLVRLREVPALRRATVQVEESR